MLLLLVVITSSSHLHKPKNGIDYYAHPQYKFSYGVNDPHTGDWKTQYEERNGDVVKGSYTVAVPDGSLRTVHYTADDHNGFNALVSKDGRTLPPKIYPKEIVSVFVAEPLIHN